MKNPPSYFPARAGQAPQGGKDKCAPSPLGEVPIAIGREGGK